MVREGGQEGLKVNNGRKLYGEGGGERGTGRQGRGRGPYRSTSARATDALSPRSRARYLDTSIMDWRKSKTSNFRENRPPFIKKITSRVLILFSSHKIF